ncbi:MAG: galactokinase [Candidatus Promineifilaceae bacterium]|nr:galactokinase [Candidatus Promineifilaceae bacterium]
MIQQQLGEAFAARYGERPAWLVRAPGRVNLIGEHTDYNDGFVMPIAIDRAVWLALRPTGGRQVTITSLDMNERAAFELEELHHGQQGWLEYVKGVAWALQEQGYALAGWEGVMAGDVPIGAGLSSSAAVEMAAARAFAAVAPFDWHPVTMARIGQAAENRWMGVNSGIMDQLISAAAEADHALLIDCRSLETEAIRLPTGTAVVILDTDTRRGLVDSAYNERRRQCERAAAFFEADALRDVDLATLKARGTALDEPVRKRARHVITENRRVLQAKAAMGQDDAQRLGRLLDASHRSLRDDFEVSSPALDLMVALAQAHEACYGARMTGAGFGGCAVALVRGDAASVETFIHQVGAAYQEQLDLTPDLFVCRAAQGTSLLPGSQ